MTSVLMQAGAEIISLNEDNARLRAELAAKDARIDYYQKTLADTDLLYCQTIARAEAERDALRAALAQIEQLALTSIDVGVPDPGDNLLREIGTMARAALNPSEQEK